VCVDGKARWGGGATFACATPPPHLAPPSAHTATTPTAPWRLRPPPRGRGHAFIPPATATTSATPTVLAPPPGCAPALVSMHCALCHAFPPGHTYLAGPHSTAYPVPPLHQHHPPFDALWRHLPRHLVALPTARLCRRSPPGPLLPPFCRGDAGMAPFPRNFLPACLFAFCEFWEEPPHHCLYLPTFLVLLQRGCLPMQTPCLWPQILPLCATQDRNSFLAAARVQTTSQRRGERRKPSHKPPTLDAYASTTAAK